MTDSKHRMQYSGSSRSSVDYLLLTRELYESAKFEAEATIRSARQRCAKTLTLSRKRFKKYAQHALQRLERKALLARSIEEYARHAEDKHREHQETLDLALAIARKIVGAELRCSSQALLAHLQATITRCRHCRPIVVELAPSDFARLSTAPSQFPDFVELRRSTLQPGEARIETHRGTIMLSISDTLEEFGYMLRQEIGKECCV